LYSYYLSLKFVEISPKTAKRAKNFYDVPDEIFQNIENTKNTKSTNPNKIYFSSGAVKTIALRSIKILLT
jgi:hypothetical protein